jgi:outer membrane protein
MKPILFALVLYLANMPNGKAAGTDTLYLNLRQAVEAAEKNNLRYQNARSDISKAEQQVREVKSIGLPQIGATGSFTQYVKIPGRYVPNFFGGGPDFLFIAFQQKYASSLNVQASQLIYDGTYLLGLRAAKEFVNVSRLLAEQNHTEMEFNVCRTYALCLNTAKNLELFEANIKNLSGNLEQIKAIYEAGFAEKLDVDRLQLSLDNLQVQRDKVKAAAEATLNMLKFAIGLDITQAVKLTDNLENLEKSLEVDAGGFSGFKPSARIEHQILRQAVALSHFDEKRYKVGHSPSLSGFIAHQRITNRPEFNFFESNLPINNTWVPATLWGLNLNIPIFDGFRKQSQIRQVQIERSKTLNQISDFENMVGMEYINARQAWLTGMQAVEIQKKNLALAERIYEQVNLKFREGVGSTIEILSAETELKNAQIQYLNALYELSLAKMDLRKATGQTIIP